LYEKKLLCNTEYKQKVSEVSLPYDGSALKKCTRFTEGVAEIIHPLNIELSCLRIIVNGDNVKFENFYPNYE
jgi:hypothetical protein